VGGRTWVGIGPAVGAGVRTPRAAATSSRQEVKRSCLALAMARWTTPSIAGGSSGRSAVTRGGANSRWATSTASLDPAGNGGRPVRHSYSTQPSE